MKKPSFLISIIFVSMCLGCGKGQNTQSQGSADSLRAADSLGSEAIALPANLDKSSPSNPLRYKFTVGEKFGLEITTIESVRITRDTTVQKNEQTLTYRYVFEVLETAADGGGTVRATCTKVNFSGDYADVKGQKKMTYNSDEKNSREKDKVFAQYIAPYKVPLVVRIDALGKILSISNVGEAVKKLLGEDYATAKLETKKQLEKDLSENSLKNTLQLGFLKLDEKNIKVDSSWTIAWSGAIGFMRLNNVAVYTLKGFTNSNDGRLAHVVVKMKSQYVGGKTVDTGEGMATIETFDVSGSGVSVFNVDKGRCGERSLQQKIFAKFFIEPPEELKKLAPDQAKNFFMTQDAKIENRITSFTP